MMENTLENKAKVFGYYLHQRVLLWHNKSPLFNLLIDDFKSNTFPNYLLSLKPLSSITDEDAIEVATIVSNSIRNADTGDLVTLFYTEVIKDPYVLAFASYETVDYLRSKGYALPWMGLSVEKLKEYGWIKLEIKSDV